MTKITHEGFVLKIKDLVQEEYRVLGEYKNMSTKIKMRHEKCLHEYEVNPSSFVHSGTRCPNCNGRKKVTREMFSSHIETKGYTLIGHYVKYTSKVEVKHNECGHRWSVYPQNLYQNKSGCPKCSGNAKITPSEFNSRVLSMYPNNEYTFLEEYKGYFELLKCRHECGFEWETAPHNFLRGKGCPKCEGSMKLTQRDIDIRMEDLFQGEYTFVEPYINSDTPILCKHTCGHTWKVRPYNLFGGRRCPKCKRESKRESLIATELDKYKVVYEREKTFEGCRYKGLLRIDFYLPEYTTAIEYDGEHHFIDYRYTNSNSSLELVQMRDNIKDEYCKDNNIKIYRIPYTKTDEEIIEILKKIINVESNTKALLTKNNSEDIV